MRSDCVPMAAVAWPVCVLVLGLAFIAALWDGLRRYADARGARAQLEDRLSAQAEAIELIKLNSERLITECAQEITAVKNGLGLRITRAG